MEQNDVRVCVLWRLGGFCFDRMGQRRTATLVRALYNDPAEMCRLTPSDDFILIEPRNHASPAGLYDAIPSSNVPNILSTQPNKQQL